MINGYLEVLIRFFISLVLIVKSFMLVTVSLKPELFEGMRFDFNKPLNPKFFLSHRCFLLFVFFVMNIHLLLWFAFFSWAMFVPRQS